jgi:hypothetical protein
VRERLRGLRRGRNSHRGGVRLTNRRKMRADGVLVPKETLRTDERLQRPTKAQDVSARQSARRMRPTIYHALVVCIAHRTGADRLQVVNNLLACRRCSYERRRDNLYVGMSAKRQSDADMTNCLADICVRPEDLVNAQVLIKSRHGEHL